jgi:hypothetical protein
MAEAGEKSKDGRAYWLAYFVQETTIRVIAIAKATS